VAWALAALAIAPSALGDVAPVRLVYEAPPECPDKASFLEQLRAQTPNARPLDEGTPARTLAVRVSRDGEALNGRLHIEELDGATSTREVSGAGCEEVVSALALVTALAIDAGPISTPPAPTASPKLPPPPRPRPSSPPPSPPKATFTTAPPAARWELGVQAGAFGAIAPDLAWGGIVFVDRSEWGRTGLAYGFRVGLSLVQSPTVSRSEGQASFQWAAVRLSGCPLALTAFALTARPCAGLDVGALTGEGAGIARPLRATRPWVAATLSARVAVLFAGRFVAEVEAGLTLPMIRDRFVFERPDQDLHAVPALGGFGTAGLGVSLW